jgi:hypothetical protein
MNRKIWIALVFALIVRGPTIAFAQDSEVHEAHHTRIYHFILKGNRIKCRKDDLGDPHIALCDVQVDLSSPAEIVLNKSLQSSRIRLDSSPEIYVEQRQQNHLTFHVRVFADTFNVTTDDAATSAVTDVILELVTVS